MIRDLPLVFHIGYHKTATTYLQKLIFPAHPGIVYPGRNWKSKSLGSYFIENQFTHPIDFEPSLMRDRFYVAMEEYIADEQIDMSHKKAILISHESLHSGAEYFGADFMMMADRLKVVFPGAKIIIGIRNQLDYIESNYRTYVMHGGKLNFHYFIHRSFAFNYGLKPKLYFDKAIQVYRERFGAENVYVYLLEDFKKNLNKELDQLFRFVGTDGLAEYKKDSVNVGLNKYSIFILRMLNRLFAKDFNEQYFNWQYQRLSSLEKIRWKMVRAMKKFETTGINFSKRLCDESTKKVLFNMFFESNLRLGKLLHRDLKKDGYF